MNYKGHLGMGVLGFGVVANSIELQYTHNNYEITAMMAIAMFSASKIIDQDLKFAAILPKDMRSKRYLYHRQITHSLILWLGFLLYGMYGADIAYLRPGNMEFIISNYYIFFFAVGGLTHLFADMLTGSIPILLWGKYGRGLRIGINIDSTKKLLVKLGDKSYLAMMGLGIYLIYKTI